MMKYNNDITFSKRFTQFAQQSFHKQILDPLEIYISYKRGWNKQINNALCLQQKWFWINLNQQEIDCNFYSAIFIRFSLQKIWGEITRSNLKESGRIQLSGWLPDPWVAPACYVLPHRCPPLKKFQQQKPQNVLHNFYFYPPPPTNIHPIFVYDFCLCPPSPSGLQIYSPKPISAGVVGRIPGRMKNLNSDKIPKNRNLQ